MPVDATMRDLLRLLRVRVASRGRARVSRSARISRGARVVVARGARVVLCPSVVLGEGARVEAVGGEVRVGRGARVGERAVVVGHAGVSIEARAVVGDWAAVSDVAPGYADVERPIRVQPLSVVPIVVGAGAVIGPHAVVSVSLAAGAEIEPYSVVDGEQTAAAAAC